MNKTREKLITAMKQLLWEKGFDATSPNDVLEKAGVGKGSLYHHFDNKKSLAIAAMLAFSEEMRQELSRDFESNNTGLDKIKLYMSRERDSLKGCRLGRIIQDPSLSDPDLKKPIADFFSYAQEKIESAIIEAINDKQLAAHTPIKALSTSILSVIQGGYVIGKAFNNAGTVNEACECLLSLLTINKS